MSLGRYFSPPPDVEVRAQWDQLGRPTPPPDEIKRGVLRAYGRAFGCRVLIETGTYLGDTIWAMKDEFRQLHTIELHAELASKARERFRAVPNVKIHEGDSARLLGEILKSVKETCLIWLDGHCSGAGTAHGELYTPVMRELATIFAHPVRNHVVVIDDARLFSGKRDYPTLTTLSRYVRETRPDYMMEVCTDSTRLTLGS